LGLATPPHTGIVAALLLGMVVLLQQFAWLDMHTALETWDDDAGLFRLALCLEAGLGEPCAVGAPYPPLVPWITSLFFRGQGEANLSGALMSQWPFLVLLMGALFVGMRRVAGEMAGLAALALGPVLVWSLHIRSKYYTEVPLAAISLAAVVALVASEGFRRRSPSVLFGVFLGLGLLTKWSFAFFLGPIATLALIRTLFEAIAHPRLRWVIALIGLAVPCFILAGAGGWMTYGLTIGVWSGVGLSIVLAWAHRTGRGWFEGGAEIRLVNLGLMVVVVLVIAGPWYWNYLPSMQEFLASNLAQKFHGDPVRGVMGWPFYPAVLTTRMMSTPVLVLFAAGVLLAFKRGAPPLVRVSLFGLLVGILVLGILPYRSGRYLVAGLGMLTPVVLWPLVRWPRFARVALPLTILVSLVHQTSWIPLAADGAKIPHHWPILSLPEPDLMGNTHRGIYQAYQDLLHPRWRFLPVANPPIHRVTPSSRLVEAIVSDAGETPSLTMVLDPFNRLNLNAMATELAGHRPPPTTRIVAAKQVLSPANLRAWRQRARKPRDQPATASGPPVPRNLYLAVVHLPQEGPDRRQVALLKANGFVAIDRDGVLSAFEPVGTTLWGAEGR
jgi:4-amino-4-deoxy-L-arabinose transferase-like glycosyltransferase